MRFHSGITRARRRALIKSIARLAQIHQPHLRQPGHAMTPRQHMMLIAPGGGVDEAFQRWRGRCQHDGRAFDPCPHHRHVAGMIKRAFLLLEGLFVFLVHHEQAQLAERQEQG